MKKILIIEANRELRENTAELLELEKYKVITASNAKSGIELSLQYRPDLIISDLTSAELGGQDTVKALSSFVHTKKVPIIFLTSKSGNADRYIGKDLSSDAYLIKPYDVEELLKTVADKLAGASYH